MMPGVQAVDDSQPVYWAEQEDTADRKVMVLMILGMIASVIAFLSLREALRTQLKPNEFYSENIVKSQLFYVAHAAQIGLLMITGTLALVATDMRTLTRGYILRFMLFIGAATLMTFRGYSLSELLTTKVFDGSGPFPCFLSVLIFVGARRGNWRAIDRTFTGLAVVFGVFTILGIAQLRTFTRPEAVASLAGFLNVLFWAASWIALRYYEENDVWGHFRFGPALLYAIGSLFTQTRLNFVMLFALLGAYAFVQYKRGTLRLFGWVATLAAVVWLSLFTVIFLSDVKAVERVASVSKAFSSRIDEDSRTGQLISFAENVPGQDLLLGRGSLATWLWDSEEWRGGTDVGYLTLLLYGGLPLLLTYCWAHISPGLKAFNRDETGVRLTAACIVLLWGVRMFSSSYPSLSIEYYPILLCLGICVYREPQGF